MIAHTSHITQLLLDLRRPKQLKGCLRLYELAGADGMAILTGGVRGWAETLGCGVSYPKILFAELEALEIISGIDYFPGDGGQVAHIYLHQQSDSITDRNDEEAPLLELEAGSRPDAISTVPDRSLIVPPCTPHVDDHDSLQQQQHARARENTTPDTKQPEAALTRLLLAEFPHADLALLDAWEANPRVNDCKAARDALAGSPKATLADWKTDLAAAEDRPNSDWPVGLVLACWSRGERVTPRRAPRVTPQKQSRRETSVSIPAAPALELPDDGEIREDTELAPADRAAFLAEYLAADDDETRHMVLRTFRRAVAERMAQTLTHALSPTAPAEKKAPSALPTTLPQIWQAAMYPIQQRLERREFDTWLRGTCLLALEDGQATILAPSALHKEGLENRHLNLIRRSISDVLGVPVQVRVVTAASP